MSGVATFDLRAANGTLITTARVLGLFAGNSFNLPVDVTSASSTGIAMANASSGPVSVRLRLLGDAVEAVLPFGSRQQTADFVTAWFPQLARTIFRGTLVLEVISGALNSLVATALTVAVAEEPTANNVLPAPVITRPECGAVTVWPEGLFTLAWERVDTASTYTVEVDCLGCGDHRDPWFSQSGSPWHVRSVVDPIYRTDIISTLRREGGRTMRWRVWAVDARGVEGTKSGWCVAAFSENGLPTPGSGTCEHDPR